MLLSNTNPFSGIKGCHNWNEMYMIFVNKDFHMDDEDLVVYQNNKKSELYAITTGPNIMPYNDIVQYIFLHLEPSTTSIVNEARTHVASI
jgi:hypothetical protein